MHDNRVYRACKKNRRCEVILNSQQTQPAGQLVPADPADRAELQRTTAAAQAYIAESLAPNTIKAYQSDWADFTAWCAKHQREPLPAIPHTVILYLSHLAQLGRKPSTIERRCASIKQAHRFAHHPSPTDTVEVEQALRGIRRSLKVAPTQKAAAVTEIVRAMIEALPDKPSSLRDKALLLIGFVGAFRRSELVSLDVRDITFTNDGLAINLRQSKTDQEGAGYLKGLPYGSNPDTCPVRTLHAWLDAGHITEGPIFRSFSRRGVLQAKRLEDGEVARIIKRAARAAGLDAQQFSGHSLRAGFVTAAAAAGEPEYRIMEQTGHTSSATVRRYMRRGNLFRNNSASKIGL
ncbi:MAG: tyrosine-type recombinase/integrase [Roseiflexaceae bacterium]|nr:tyrosine-type recombinase/integrase [Roseiflexaceae bacterium]